MFSNEYMPQNSKKDKPKGSETTKSYSWFTWGRSNDSKSKKSQDLKTVEEVFVMKEEGYQEAEMAIPAIEEKIEKEEGYLGSNSSEESDGSQKQTGVKLPVDRRYYQQSDKFRKTLRLTSEQIVSLV